MNSLDPILVGLTAVLTDVSVEKQKSGHGAGARELALAATKIEEAILWYERSLLVKNIG